MSSAPARVGALLALAAATAVTFGGLAQASSASRKVTVYAVATRAQYADHADDRSRGNLDNPFNADVKPSSSSGSTTRAGDNALYSFRLYSDAAFKHRVGSASYSCTFTTAHLALCEGDFELNTGALFATGPADFGSPAFTIAVSGGTGSFLGARGQVSSAPAAKDATRLTFVLR